MNTKWYEVKVRYVKQFEDGRLKKVTEPYLFDAVSFTEAEARAYEELAPQIRGDFSITTNAIREYADVVDLDTDNYYQIKVSMIQIDPDSMKEKKTISKYLICAENVQHALSNIHDILEGCMVGYEVIEIKKTKIIDIFPYKNEDERVEHT